MLGFIKYGIPVILVTNVMTFVYAKHLGKMDYQTTLLKGRIITQEQVRKVDNDVSSADDSGLCALLGGC